MRVLSTNFKVTEVDKEGKLYTNVSRANMVSDDFNAILDYHSVLYKLEAGDSLNFVLFTGIESDVDCEYLVSGEVYEIEDKKNGLVCVKISFGGLLLLFDSPKDKVANIKDLDIVTLALKKI